MKLSNFGLSDLEIKFREDPDLNVLQYASNADLHTLVKYLTRDKNGTLRPSQQLLNQPRFKAAGDKLNQVWDLIAAELQLYGGNTVSNLLRRRTGVTYREIVMDVCVSQNIKVKASDSIFDLESQLIEGLIGKLWDKLTPEQRKDFFDTITSNITNKDQALADRIIQAIKMNPTLIFATAALIATPFSGALLLASIGGPAYDVTVPSVVHIAYIRRTLTEVNRY
ncbi:DUF3944 domain-containing protein [Chromobacterium sp. ASV23]|uniref:DUF3944 domain-containing protein n=1 Tax=Chromobacterium sp. ASV23 TaxID=2795110 RepID=UPI0018EAE9D4|nr:DUF3944 domain-containing protein [Chromobacterium sp. ASV23]